MDFMPQTLYSVAQCDGTHRQPLLEMIYVKVTKTGNLHRLEAPHSFCAEIWHV